MTFTEFHRDQPIIDINLSAICENYRLLQRQAPTSEVAAVVKADGYGLGAAAIGEQLALQGCRTFFVAKFEEALALRLALPSPRIYCLHGLPPGAEEDARAMRITPVINDPTELERWKTTAHRHEKTLHAALQVDTGMARLGMASSELETVCRNWPDNLKADFLMSHLLISEDADDPRNEEQYRRFLEARAHCPDVPASLGNSGACFLDNRFHFGLIRAGIGLYGGKASLSEACRMQPVVTLTAPVIKIQRITKGTRVGYSGTWTAERDSIVATIPVGYADGYPRVGSNRLMACAGPYDIPVIGNISMDLTVLDVTDLPETLLQLHMPVQLMNNRLTINDIADKSDTICYEILTRLGSRFERRYHNDPVG